MEKYRVIITDGIIDLVYPNDFEFDENDFSYFITLHNTDIEVGTILFEDFNRDINYYGNIEYKIEREYRGKGYAKRALLLLKEVLKDKKEKMLISVFDDNIPSIKTAIKFGAKVIRKGKMPDKYILDKNSGYSNKYTIFEYDIRRHK